MNFILSSFCWEIAIETDSIYTNNQITSLVDQTWNIVRTDLETAAANVKMVGPQCCENPPTLDPTAGAGHVVELAGLKTYITGNQDSELALIFAAEVFGK